jgi:hypothetical protein
MRYACQTMPPPSPGVVNSIVGLSCCWPTPHLRDTLAHSSPDATLDRTQRPDPQTTEPPPPQKIVGDTPHLWEHTGPFPAFPVSQPHYKHTHEHATPCLLQFPVWTQSADSCNQRSSLLFESPPDTPTCCLQLGLFWPPLDTPIRCHQATQATAVQQPHALRCAQGARRPLGAVYPQQLGAH